jgi:hypothetical protein
MAGNVIDAVMPDNRTPAGCSILPEVCWISGVGLGMIVLLRRDGWTDNHKQIERICEE